MSAPRPPEPHARREPRGVAVWRGLSITLDVTSDVRTADGGHPPSSAFEKVLGAIHDPLGAATRTPVQRVVATRMVDVTPF